MNIRSWPANSGAAPPINGNIKMTAQDVICPTDVTHNKKTKVAALTTPSKREQARSGNRLDNAAPSPKPTTSRKVATMDRKKRIWNAPLLLQACSTCSAEKTKTPLVSTNVARLPIPNQSIPMLDARPVFACRSSTSSCMRLSV